MTGWQLYAPRHQALRDDVRSWVADRLRPNARAWEEARDFPREVFADAGRAGIFGWKVPVELGGTGVDLLADAVVTEELAACGSGGVAAALGAHKDLGSYYIARFGTSEQRARWVPSAVAGSTITALAVTEPGAGSDVAGIRTRAVQAGGDWMLTGTKTFITNGSRADVVVVLAVTDSEAGGHHGQSLFVVESTDPGFSTRRIPTLGWRTSHTGELHFADVRLPADRLLGGPDGQGQGFVYVMRNFQWERLVMALAAVRGAEGLLEALPDAAREHTAVIDRAVEVAAARQLTEHALRLHLSGQDDRNALREVSMAKWYACEVAVSVAETSLAALGGPGYRTAAPVSQGTVDVERALRDARLGPIGGGTAEIMLEVIGRSYGL